MGQKKVYFASDFHLGISVKYSSEEREKQIVSWLDSIKSEADRIYLVGDLFDFWFEYKHVVPRGYIRLLGKLAELSDSGIQLFIFTGNHDMWMFDYLSKELNAPLYRTPVIHEISGKKFFIGHGDGLGPGDYGYKMIKKIFANKICQWLFARLHPNFGIALANFFSGRSRGMTRIEEQYLGDDREWLWSYANTKSKTVDADYFIFGHRHLPIDVQLENKKSRYINLGEWMNFNSYAVFDGKDLEVKFFQNQEGRVYP
ncbi:MAG: UDP-2,3-diacylglucosamine diphosphatase [Bacteroidia bacterium]|nr:UDP-2,3-diacylglucosamine diphosphatase [Bacteroidia bacterium]